MEFFRRIERLASADRLQFQIDPVRLDSTLVQQGEEGFLVVCPHGIAPLCRELIAGGVRFTVPESPEALQWTVTVDGEPNPEGLLLHCSTNRSDHDFEFVEAVHTLLDRWQDWLERAFP